MMQKKWFKLFIWFASSALFFLASGILISMNSPGTNEQQTMLYMSGMMKAMESSLMGLSMTIEEDTELRNIISNITSVTTALIIISIAAGDYVRLTRRKKNG